MELGLGGKAAIVTGASKGIGRAIALGLAREGVNVAICARGEAALRATEQELAALGVTVLALPCDVADPAALDAFLEAAYAQFGRIDILVNNASALAMGVDEDDWQASLNVDLLAAVRACRRVVPWMAGAGGAIIHIASGSGLEAGSPPAYAAAKAALISHSKTLAVALGPQKIRVNAMALGSIDFPDGFWDRVRQTNPDLYAGIVATIPWGRMGTAEEVADAAAFLASERASWITGVCLGVDGGQRKANL